MPDAWTAYQVKADLGSAYPLADVLEKLGGEIREASRRAREDNQPDVLLVSGIEVELGVTFTKKGEAGIEIGVVNLGGDLTKENTQTIKLTLIPKDGNIVASFM